MVEAHHTPHTPQWVVATSTTELATHKESRSHRRNRVFQLYQREKEELLRSPHPLGLEVRVGEVEQGVVHSPEQGTVTITTSPGQAKAFQVVLLNTRDTDAAEEREEGKPDQIGLIVEQMGVMRAETVFQLQVTITSPPHLLTSRPHLDILPILPLYKSRGNT